MPVATAPCDYSIVPAAELVARGLAHVTVTAPAAPDPDRIPVYGGVTT